MPTCYLAGAAPGARDPAPPIAPGDFVIAADGGCGLLRQWGLTPDLIIGDLDSLAGPLPEGVPCIRAPAEKDETDMELALLEGVSRWYRVFGILGGYGGRPDHTIANLQLLAKAAQMGARAVLHAGSWRCAALCGGTPAGELALRGKGIVSVFAWGAKAEGVTIAGMKYPLAGEDLDSTAPRGVSNELDGEGRVTLEKGILLCFWEETIQSRTGANKND